MDHRDAMTIAAEEIDKLGEASKRDDEVSCRVRVCVSLRDNWGVCVSACVHVSLTNALAQARSDASDERIHRFGTVVVSFKFEMMRSLLTVTFHGVDHLPHKNAGGASAYQLSVTIFDENEKKLCRWNSTQFSSVSFRTDQIMEFPEMSASEQVRVCGEGVWQVAVF